MTCCFNAPTLRSAQVLKQEAEDIDLTGKDVAEYVTRQQALEREERAAWIDTQKMQAQADEDPGRSGGKRGKEGRWDPDGPV